MKILDTVRSTLTQPKVVRPATTLTMVVSLAAIGAGTAALMGYLDLSQASAIGSISGGVIFFGASMMSFRRSGGFAPFKLRIVTINTGTNADFKAHFSYAAKYDNDLTETIRRSFFQHHVHTDKFSPLSDADIYCLQETGKCFSKEYLTRTFPTYTCISDTDGANQNTVIMLKNSTFEVGNSGAIFDNFSIGTSWAYLTHRSSGFTFLAGSGYIQGFSLATPAEGLSGVAENGDTQLRQIHKVFEEVECDVRLIGMDANATWQHYPARLEILQQYSFSSDREHPCPTYLDANLNVPVELDHVAWKAREGITVSKDCVDAPLGYERDAKTISFADHAPRIVELTFTKQS